MSLPSFLVAGAVSFITAVSALAANLLSHPVEVVQTYQAMGRLHLRFDGHDAVQDYRRRPPGFAIQSARAQRWIRNCCATCSASAARRLRSSAWTKRCAPDLAAAGGVYEVRRGGN